MRQNVAPDRFFRISLKASGKTLYYLKNYMDKAVNFQICVLERVPGYPKCSRQLIHNLYVKIV